MYNWRKPIIYSLLYISGSKIPRFLKEIKRVNKLPIEDQKKYQEEKLKKLLLHAWENVPYYSKVLEESGVVKEGEVFLENFEKIPILTKDIIRKEKDNLYSKDYKNRGFYENTSGGSTGEPVKFIQDKNYSDWNIANKIFYKLVANQNLGNKELRFWGSERDLLDGREKLSIRLRNWIYNRKEFNTFRMSEKQMFDYVEKWNSFEPSWVEAYVQSIYEFAKFIQKNNLNVKSPKNGILTSAGTLYPDMKETIEKVFKCKVYNRYGSREVGDIACGSSELHVSLWNQHLEIINENIYVTNLNNLSMPLIKYNIGDLAQVSNKKFYLTKIIGRENELFKKENGDMIDGGFFRQQLYNKSWIVKYQIIQKEYNLIIYKIILNGNKNENDIKIIKKNIKKVMGKECKIKWEFVNEIPLLSNGKYLYTINKLK